MEANAPRVALFSIYRVFFWIGLLSFGGGLMPWIQREVVTVRGWLTDEQFFPGMALAQVLPGVNSTNIAIYVGQHVRGAAGAAVALAAMLTGPFCMVLLAAASYKFVLGVPAIQVAAAGVATAAIGMLLRTGISAAQATGREPLALAVMVATFVAIGLLHYSLIPVVAVMTPISILLSWPRGNRDA
jgi:chromate transporter